MLLLRLVGILTMITIGSSIFAWLVTREPRYLILAKRTAKAALGFSLIVLLLITAERLIIL